MIHPFTGLWSFHFGWWRVFYIYIFLESSLIVWKDLIGGVWNLNWPELNHKDTILALCYLTIGEIDTKKSFKGWNSMGTWFLKFWENWDVGQRSSQCFQLFQIYRVEHALCKNFVGDIGLADGTSMIYFDNVELYYKVSVKHLGDVSERNPSSIQKQWSLGIYVAPIYVSQSDPSASLPSLYVCRRSSVPYLSICEITFEVKSYFFDSGRTLIMVWLILVQWILGIRNPPEYQRTHGRLDWLLEINHNHQQTCWCNLAGRTISSHSHSMKVTVK